MDIKSNMKMKISKKLTQNYKHIENENNLDVRLYGYGCNNIGFIIVTRELKNSLEGYIGRCSDEEFRNKCLQKLNFEIV